MARTITLNTIKPKMNSSRNDLVRTLGSRSKKALQFCNDNDAFNWACRFYRYNYIAYHGNVEPIRSDTFGQIYTIITDKYNYDIALDELMNDYMADDSDKETKYLIDMMAKLRKKYRM